MSSWLLKKHGPPITSVKTVSWLVSYQQYYRELNKLIGKLARKGRRGDEIFISAWRLDIATPLAGDNLEDLLRAAVGRGVRLRALISGYTAVPTINKEAVKRIKALGGEAKRDWQSPPKLASFHQKAVYLKKGSDHVLLLGGMDIANGRRGDGRTGTWRDAQAKIVGAAAKVGLRTLLQRWASLEGKFPPARDHPRTRHPPGNGPAFVQFVRTYGKPGPSNSGKEQKSLERKYAHQGVYETSRLLRHAAKKAESFIYIEDQYFVGDRVGKKPPYRLPSVDVALAEAVGRGVQVLAVTTWAEQAGPFYVPKRRRKELLDLLRSKSTTPDDQVKLYRFKARHVAKNFVHTKVWIFDDELAVVTSANYTRMSMTNEPEFGIGVVSKEKSDLVPSLRRKLWLGLLNAPGTAWRFSEREVSTFEKGRQAFASSRSPLELYPDNEKLEPANQKPGDPDGS